MKAEVIGPMSKWELRVIKSVLVPHHVHGQAGQADRILADTFLLWLSGTVCICM